jgi:chromosome segregation ATPase
MDEILLTLQQVHRKVARLEREIDQLRQAKAEAEAQVQDLAAQVQERDEAYAALQQQYEAARAIQGLSMEGDREALQAKIDLYLQEIDICLKNFGE